MMNDASEVMQETQNALDQLFSLTIQYRSSQAYFELLNFISKFRRYSPFNAFLINTQKRGAVYVATAQRWYHVYGHRIKPNAQPIVILQPMGPVMFVFDIADTEPIPDMKDVLPIPSDILKPFEIKRGTLKSGHFERLIENAKRDGIRVSLVKYGSCSAGLIRWSEGCGEVQLFQSGIDKRRVPIMVEVPVRYELFINTNGQSREAQYATFAHELAHLYCGHLGTPDIRLWPDRQNLDHTTREFEAESVSYLICNRQGIETTSPNYLADFVASHSDIPHISMESVMKAAGLIETMSCTRLKPRDKRSR